jgi:hypothetical protein
MNLVKALLKEHSKAQCNRIVKYIGTDKGRFSELVQVFTTRADRVSQRAAWPLSYCAELHPELLKPHLKNVIQNLNRPGLHDAVKRNTLRFLQFIPIPKSLQGTTTHICFDLLQNRKEAIAVRVFAMTVLANIAKSQPDLKSELKIIIEDNMPIGSAGFVSRGRKILKELKD